MYLNIFEWVMLIWFVSLVTIIVLNFISNDFVNTFLKKWEKENPGLRSKILFFYFFFPVIWGVIWLFSWFMGFSV